MNEINTSPPDVAPRDALIPIAGSTDSSKGLTVTAILIERPQATGAQYTY